MFIFAISDAAQRSKPPVAEPQRKAGRCTQRLCLCFLEQLPPASQGAERPPAALAGARQRADAARALDSRHIPSGNFSFPRTCHRLAAMATECTYQFSCPSCSALLQAVLKQALTSVQCGECFDVFDVQMPSL